MREPTLLELLKNGVHFGHQTSKWHPRMRPFIFTSRNGIHILNLEKTLEYLIRAQQFVYNLAAQGGTIVFIGTKRQAKDIVRAAAEKSGSFFVTERWLGGLLTNFGTVSKVIERLRTLSDDRQAGRLEKYTKKERLGFDEEIAKLEKLVGGLRQLTKLPSAMIIVDVKTEKTAVREARKMNIPLVAMLDTNTDPEGIAHPIPANDDATKSIELIMDLLADAILEGKEVAAAAVAQAAANEPVPETAPVSPQLATEVAALESEVDVPPAQ